MERQRENQAEHRERHTGRQHSAHCASCGVCACASQPHAPPMITTSLSIYAYIAVMRHEASPLPSRPASCLLQSTARGARGTKLHTITDMCGIMPPSSLPRSLVAFLLVAVALALVVAGASSRVDLFIDFVSPLLAIMEIAGELRMLECPRRDWWIFFPQLIKWSGWIFSANLRSLPI